jgi:ubiquinone/menaquinone biosynthesis C-methylase UbiE
MLSIEEIKLLIEKLKKVKKEDFEKLINSNLEILQDLHDAVDANNKETIDRLDKTPQWFQKDLESKLKSPFVDNALYQMVQTKIFQFAKSNLYNSLEIGPGNGMFSKEFRSWRKNFFVDILPQQEKKIRRRFPPAHQKYLQWYTTKATDCGAVPSNSCNFVFSWDTFVFFTQEHINQYLKDIRRVLIDGGYVFINYADCHYDIDFNLAKRGYWNYNTKSAMEKMILDNKFNIIEMNQFRPGANYAIFKKPGKLNPVIYKFRQITLD